MRSTRGARPHPALRATFLSEGKERPRTGEGGEQRRMGHPFHGRAKDGLGDVVEMTFHVVVPEAKHLEAGSCQGDQLCLQASEVDHEAVQRHLPPDGHLEEPPGRVA